MMCFCGNFQTPINCFWCILRYLTMMYCCINVYILDSASGAFTSTYECDIPLKKLQIVTAWCILRCSTMIWSSKLFTFQCIAFGTFSGNTFHFRKFQPDFTHSLSDCFWCILRYMTLPEFFLILDLLQMQFVGGGGKCPSPFT